MLGKLMVALGFFFLLSLCPVDSRAQETVDGQEILYVLPDKSAPNFILRDGRFGKLSILQQALKSRLTQINPTLGNQFVVDGIVGKGTAQALRLVLSQLVGKPAQIDSAKDLPITVDTWRSIVGSEPPPTIEERAETWVLTYEATPFDRIAEWNYCQRNGNRPRRQSPCRTNDDSLLTWGPRGATATSGREIQGVLIALEQSNPALVSGAFGTEYPVLQKALSLSSNTPPGAAATGVSRQLSAVSDLELFLCPIWLDPRRAAAWANSFARLGTFKETQRIYNHLYRSSDFDGGKMRSFYQLYARLGVPPSQVDFAFFTDRATHTGGIGHVQIAASKVRSKLGAGPWQNWQVRRAIAQVFPAGTQTTDRLGRDVAFFVGSVGVEGLTGEELAAWRQRSNGISAVTFGLDDNRPAPVLNIDETSWPTLLTLGVSLTSSERERLGCPSWVVNREKVRG
jgi:hypothetical protein